MISKSFSSPVVFIDLRTVLTVKHFRVNLFVFEINIMLFECFHQGIEILYGVFTFTRFNKGLFTSTE